MYQKHQANKPDFIFTGKIRTVDKGKSAAEFKQTAIENNKGANARTVLLTAGAIKNAWDGIIKLT